LNRGRRGSAATTEWGRAMSVVKIIELVGESSKSWDDAIRNVVAEAQKTLRGITRIGVSEFDVRMNKDKLDVFRVRAEVSFRLER
jgi:flavin-binding protein dodecin